LCGSGRLRGARRKRISTFGAIWGGTIRYGGRAAGSPATTNALGASPEASHARRQDVSHSDPRCWWTALDPGRRRWPRPCPLWRSTGCCAHGSRRDRKRGRHGRAPRPTERFSGTLSSPRMRGGLPAAKGLSPSRRAARSFRATPPPAPQATPPNVFPGEPSARIERRPCPPGCIAMRVGRIRTA